MNTESQANVAAPRVVSQRPQPAARVKATPAKGGGSKVKAKDPLDQPIVPGSSLTLRQARALVAADTRLHYQPQMQAVQQRQAEAGSWFDAYKQQVAQAASQNQARYQAAIGGVQQQAAADSAQQTSQNQQLAAQQQASAAQRGAVYSGVPTQQAQAAGNQAQNQQGAFAALLQAQGAAQGAYDAGQGQVGGAAQLGARLKAAQDLEALKGQAADYRTTAMGTLQSNEAKNVLEQAAFGLKQTTQADTVAGRKAARVVSRKNNAANNATSRSNNAARIQAQNDRQAAADAKQKHQDATKEQQRIQKVRDKSGAVVSQLQGAIDSLGTYSRAAKTPPTSDQLALLLHDDKVNPVLVKAALEIAGPGGQRYLSKGSIDALHAMGVRVPRKWLLGKTVGSAVTQGAAGAS